VPFDSRLLPNHDLASNILTTSSVITNNTGHIFVDLVHVTLHVNGLNVYRRLLGASFLLIESQIKPSSLEVSFSLLYTTEETENRLPVGFEYGL
jgi:hypothetical protein